MEHHLTQNSNLMKTSDAANFLKLSEAYFARDRWLAKKNGTAPQIPFVQIGRAVRYRYADLQEFIIRKGNRGNAA